MQGFNSFAWRFTSCNKCLLNIPHVNLTGEGNLNKS